MDARLPLWLHTIHCRTKLRLPPCARRLAVSDEILWETRISPFSRVRAIPDDEIQELEINIKKVLNNATAMIKRNYQDEIPNNTTEVLKIHGQVKSPTGFKIHIDADRGLKTYYTLEQMLYRK